MPFRIQFSAARGAGKMLLELACEIEAAAPWMGRRPGVWVG